VRISFPATQERSEKAEPPPAFEFAMPVPSKIAQFRVPVVVRSIVSRPGLDGLKVPDIVAACKKDVSNTDDEKT
jgi:hypothetical protein